MTAGHGRWDEAVIPNWLAKRRFSTTADVGTRDHWKSASGQHQPTRCRRNAPIPVTYANLSAAQKLAVRSCGLTERLREPDDRQGRADIGTSLPFPAGSLVARSFAKRTNDRRLASSRHDKSCQCFQHAGRTAQMGDGLEAATVVLSVKMRGQRMMELVGNLPSVAGGGDRKCQIR